MNARRLRIEPLNAAEWRADVRELLEKRIGRNEPPNVYKTMANHPDLMRSWMALGEHVLFHSTLSAVERELIILRMGWLCEAPYEWNHHLQLGRGAGLSEADIEAIREGPSASRWDDKSRLLLEATDELKSRAWVSDRVWAALGQHFGKRQLMDIVFTAGQYNLACMALNTFGVQLEDWAEHPGPSEGSGGGEKHEFASPGWFRVLNATLVRLARSAGSQLRDVRWSVCEVFTDVPLHLAQTVERRIAWYCRLRDGKVEFGLREIDDADYKVVADYETVLPLARLTIGTEPAALRRVEEVRSRALAERKMRMEGSRDGYPVALATLHDEMVKVTR